MNINVSLALLERLADSWMQLVMNESWTANIAHYNSDQSKRTRVAFSWQLQVPQPEGQNGRRRMSNFQNKNMTTKSRLRNNKNQLLSSNLLMIE